MEESLELFSLTDVKGIPVWDLVRYKIFISYFYQTSVNQKNTKRAIEYFQFIVAIFNFSFRFMFFSKKKYLFQTVSRYLCNGYFYDKTVEGIIRELQEDSLVLETLKLKGTSYRNVIYDLAPFFRRINKRARDLDMSIFSTIEEALIMKFSECKVTYDDLNRVYRDFQSDVVFYNMVIKRFSPHKIFLSHGNPKAIIWVARKYNIETILCQHCAILLDEIDCSYPKYITYKSNIIFSDKIFTYGPYWGKNVNIPVKDIIPLGNDFHSNVQLPSNSCSSRMILIISSLPYGNILAEFIRVCADSYSDYNFIFKLHSSEFNIKLTYEEYFKLNKNVLVVSDEMDTSQLIAEAELVLLIISTVLFEALNMNKKVAIYKRLGYERYCHYLGDQVNLYYIDTVSALREIIEKKVEYRVSGDAFFIPMDKNILKDEVR